MLVAMYDDIENWSIEHVLYNLIQELKVLFKVVLQDVLLDAMIR